MAEDTSKFLLFTGVPEKAARSFLAFALAEAASAIAG